MPSTFTQHRRAGEEMDNDEQQLRDDMRDVYSALNKKLDRNGELLSILVLTSVGGWLCLLIACIIFSISYYTNNYTLANPDTGDLLADVMKAVLLMPIIVLITLLSIMQYMRFSKLDKKKETYINRYPWLAD